MKTVDFFSKNFSLQGRVALVTGGSGGIGLGIAEALAGAGAKVCITGRNLELAVKSAESLRANGCDVSPIQLDPANESSVVEACRSVIAAHGAPWILVNNAGKQDGQLILDGTVEHWDQTYATNLRGPFLLTREIGRAMVEAADGGRIINVATRAIQGYGPPGLAAYISSKNGMVALSMASAQELVEHQITVNTVLPGGVITPGTQAAARPKVDPARRRGPPPLGFSKPEDIAAAVLFLASPSARAITNQVLAVDGGFSVA